MGESSAIIYSITETAKAYNLNSFRYLEHVLTVLKDHQDDTVEKTNLWRSGRFDVYEQMRDLCFIIQPFDKGCYDQRYKDVIKPAVESCGLDAYRVDEDYNAEIPISTIEKKIEESSLVIAEITTDNPNVWFELGYAFACNKTVILLCADKRKKFPFDISHRSIIIYGTRSISDFEDLKIRLCNSIKSRYTSKKIIDQDCISKEELFILKFISNDQKIPFAITAEEKIMHNSLDRETVSNCLKRLIQKGYLEYSYSTNGGESYYRVTDKAEKYLSLDNGGEKSYGCY